MIKVEIVTGLDYTASFMGHKSLGMRNIFFVLSGEWEVTASDGEARRFSSGSVLLVEDTTGQGHSSRVVSRTDSLAALVRLE